MREYGFVQFGGGVDCPRSKESTLYNLICSDSDRVDLDILLLCELARLLWRHCTGVIHAICQQDQNTAVFGPVSQVKNAQSNGVTDRGG